MGKTPPQGQSLWGSFAVEVNINYRKSGVVGEIGVYILRM
jgi:hypothetical protein